MMCTLLLQESNILKFLLLYISFVASAFLHFPFPFFSFSFSQNGGFLASPKNAAKNFQEFEYNQRFTFTGEKAEMLMDMNLHKPTT